MHGHEAFEHDTLYMKYIVKISSSPSHVRMGSEIDVIQCYDDPSVALWIESVGWHYLS